MLNEGSARQVEGSDSQLLTVTANVSLTAKRELDYSYSGDIQGENIVVDSEHAEIILRLSSDLGASFAGNPITWLAYDKPEVEIPQPECFTVTRDSDLQTTIRDWNNAASHGHYRFIINIICKDERYVLDPTVLNKPLPTSPPPEPPPPAESRSLRAA